MEVVEGGEKGAVEEGGERVEEEAVEEGEGWRKRSMWRKRWRVHFL